VTYNEKFIEAIKLHIRRIIRALRVPRTKDKKSMIEITPAHIDKLIEIESSIQYDKPPPDGEKPFVVKNRESPILISAPHGAKTYRNSKKEIWHEEDEFTAGIAQLLGELCDVSVIATASKNEAYDPNFSSDSNIAYKEEITSLIKDAGVKFVIDLHGAALNSSYLKPYQTIDLGFRSEDATERSIANKHVKRLATFLQNTGENCNPACFVVGRNGLAASGDGTITSFVFNKYGPKTDFKVQALQIEMKPQARIARRFQTATLYKS